MYIVHGTETKLVSNWEKNKLSTKHYQILCRKRISMLTGLRVSPLVYKPVFCRLEHMQNANP